MNNTKEAFSNLTFPGLFYLLLITKLVHAQPCDVIMDEPVRLFGDESTTASAVRIAQNHATGFPSIIWAGEDEKIYMSSFDGSRWSEPEVVETGGIGPAWSDFETSHPHPAMAIAINSSGQHHLLVADGNYLYHFTNDGEAWNSGEIVTSIEFPGTEESYLEVRADFDSRGVLHVVYVIDRGGEGSGRGIYYLRFLSGEWSEPQWILSGPHMHMRVGSDGAVHVVSLNFHGFVGDFRNYQCHYRQRTPDGTWLDEEQATDEPPIGILGPVSIHPAVAVDGSGVAHVIYPVDPPNPDTAPPEAGHASYITRDVASPVWSEPIELFPNAIHAAFVTVAIDPANIIYAFGLNWQKRYIINTGEGFGEVGYWNEANSRWFFFDSVAMASGAYVAYIAGRWWGPVEVVRFVRTGDCGQFCGDETCSTDEDGCSCPYDCTESCCIESTPYQSGDVNPDNPCYLCKPEIDRHHWSYDPSSPGCMLEEDTEAMQEQPEENIPEENIPEEVPIDPTNEQWEWYPTNPDTTPHETETRGGCSCSTIA